MLLTLLSSGCSAVTYVWAAYDKVTIQATQEVNPDKAGRPSPVRVKLYELSTRTVFDNLDFEGAFNKGTTLLGDQLLSQAEYMLQPGESVTHQVDLKEKAAFIAVLAAYRDIDSVRWSRIYEIKDYNHASHTVTLTKNGVVLGEVTPEKKSDSTVNPQETVDRVKTAKEPPSTPSAPSVPRY